MPRLKRQHVDAAEMQTGIQHPRTLRSTGPAKKALDPQVIEPADKMPNKAWSDQMAMNEEFVDIRLSETTDKNANPVPDIYVNGVAQRFIRGQKQKVRWKFVECLARARKTSWTQEPYEDAYGVRNVRNIPHSALEYDFSLVDSPQKFHDRLKAVMAEM